MGSNDKADGLARAEAKEINNQTPANSGEPNHKNLGPAYGGSKSGNPTNKGKISRG